MDTDKNRILDLLESVGAEPMIDDDFYGENVIVLEAGSRLVGGESGSAVVFEFDDEDSLKKIIPWG